MKENKQLKKKGQSLTNLKREDEIASDCKIYQHLNLSFISPPPASPTLSFPIQLSRFQKKKKSTLVCFL